MQQGTIARGDVLQRLAGIFFIVGTVLLAVGNALMPRASDPSDLQAVLQAIVDKGTAATVVIYLILAVGIWSTFIGFVGVYRSLSTGAAAAWARLGFYGLLIGTTLTTVLFSIVGFAGPQIAEDWSTAVEPAKATLLSIASAIDHLISGLFSMSVIVYWLALVFLGIGMVLGPAYPRWLGWAILILGAAVVAVVGIPSALSPNEQTLALLFAILAALTGVWALVTGIWTLRKAW